LLSTARHTLDLEKHNRHIHQRGGNVAQRPSLPLHHW
jgi:hypothetical protein